MGTLPAAEDLPQHAPVEGAGEVAGPEAAPVGAGRGNEGVGQMATMRQARSKKGEPIRASTYQYAPRSMVYQRNAHMDRVPETQLGSTIRATMPPELHQ